MIFNITIITLLTILFISWFISALPKPVNQVVEEVTEPKDELKPDFETNNQKIYLFKE
jgi:uncharacterized protein YggT (Ycf19 family)